jgi:hypothetical protein
LAVLWASPYSVLGLAVGLTGLATGGRLRRRGRAVEFYGGFTCWFVAHLPTGPLTLAITLGHTILGQTAAGLDLAREHEMVHVRQYERWGPAIGVAYLLCSLVLWLRGRDPYRDNPFERQAFMEVSEG